MHDIRYAVFKKENFSCFESAALHILYVGSIISTTEQFQKIKKISFLKAVAI